jgi:molybdopterin synthase sulfur carrier subunit
MVIVEFLGPIGKEPIKLDVDSLKELAKHLKEDESLNEWLKNSAIAVNDEIINDIEFKLKDGDKVSILPPVCGG